MSARFAIGDRVSIRQDYPKGHIRTPFYIRGKSGIIADIIGAFGNPESYSTYGDGLPKQYLYRVRFSQTETWPDYKGAAADSLDIEIYQHWLEPEPEGTDHAS